MMNNALGLVKSFGATTEIAKRRILAFGASEGEVVVATGPNGLLGVSGIRGAAAGETIDVYLSAPQDVEFGAAIGYGQYVTAGADGRAVPAVPAVGETIEVIGKSLEDGPVNAVCKVLIAPQQITG